MFHAVSQAISLALRHAGEGAVMVGQRGGRASQSSEQSPANSAEPGDKAKDTEPYRSAAGQMAAEGFAHEICNLMTSIVGNAALLKSALKPDNPGLRKLAAIEEAAERAAQLSQHVREYSHGGRNNAEPVNLNTIVYHVLLTDEQRLAPRVRLVRYINPDLWRAAAGHRGMSEVALELVTNAVESIRDKGRVYIGTRNVDFSKEPPPLGADVRAGHYVMLSVEDNGCGIGPGTLQRVFDPGFTTKPGRQGMGLARVQEIVSSFGGRVSVNSTEGKGTVFRVYLPAYYEGTEEATPLHLEDLPEGSETVLVIDDERMIAEIAVETLERLGYKTLVAHNGLEAVEVARTYEGPIDLILLDMVMPVMGGAEAYPLLREARPAARLIVCTGLEQDIVTGGIPEDNFASFLLKPFRPVMLAQSVRRVLDQAIERERGPLAGSKTR